MQNWLKTVFGWLAGRKTYLLALLLVVVTVTLVATNKLTPENGVVLLLLFSAGFAATFRDALERHQAQSVQIIAGTAATLRDIATKNFKAAQIDGLATVADAEVLAAQVKSDAGVTQK